MIHSWVLWTIVGYFFGSVPFGLLIGLARGVDIRRSGSGNVGATNAGRVLGRTWGLLCLVLDVTKGAAPVVLAGWAMGVDGYTLRQAQAWWWLAVAAAAMLGHMYPVWLWFRGGKGVATGLGVLLGFWPLLTIPVIASALVWLLVVAASRYVSLASMAASLAIPLVLGAHAVLRKQPIGQVTPFLACTGALACLVIVRHRSNILRLWAGTEPQVGQRNVTTSL